MFDGNFPIHSVPQQSDFTWPKSEDCGGASTPGRFTETWSYPNSWILGMSGNFAE